MNLIINKDMTKKGCKNQISTGSVIENVTGSFSDDYDIIALNSIIIEYLEYQEVKQTGIIDARKKEYEYQLKNTNRLTELQEKYYQKQLNLLNEELHNIENHTTLNAYKKSVERLLELYTAIGGGSKRIKFGQVAMSNPEEDEFRPYRLEIIREYLSISKKYMPINIIEIIPPNIQCPGCDYDLANVFADENGIQRCPKCAFERSLPSRGYCSSTTATMEVGPPKSNRNDNEEKENFIKAIIRHEGRQKDKFPPDLFTKLDHYFEINNLPKGEDIREGKSNVVISRERMFLALSYIGYPYYEHVNLIMHKYLGTKLPDLSHLENILMIHFDLTHKASQQLGIEPINTQFRLFKQLEMLGEPVNISEFRVPKTRDIIETDQENWRILCEAVSDYGKQMGIKYIPTL